MITLNKIKLNINTEINIIGGLPDFELILFLFREKYGITEPVKDLHTFSSIKTQKSVNRFRKAISNAFLNYKNKDVEALALSILSKDKLDNDSIMFLFWNLSLNNDLMCYVNDQLYFTSLYSGRITIKKEEVLACLKELCEFDPAIKAWGQSTLSVTSSKYLTLLKKFNLMRGSQTKTLEHPYLSDKMFVLFIYWLKAVEYKPNLFDSEWLKYSFCERSVFIERIMQKKFSKYFHLQYTGDNLKIETIVSYNKIYNVVE